MRISSSQESYVNEVFGLPDPELIAIKAAHAEHGVDFMSVSGAEARILQFLIRAFQIRSVVEVGTLLGYSSLAMAKALPADGRLFTLEMNPKNHALAVENFRRSKAGGKITALLGPGQELLPNLSAQGPFDMVFIDANKGGYLTYLDWAEANLRSGGLIVGDNTFLFGALWGESRDPEMGPNQIRVMKEFNARLADPTKYNSMLIPTFEGMTVAQKL